MLYVPWTYDVESDGCATVLPDGCRDVLVIATGGEVIDVRVTEWDAGPRSVRLSAGTTIAGYRLRPGATIDPKCLVDRVSDADRLARAIESDAQVDEEAGVLIDALVAPDANLRRAAQLAGVSERTLQRRFRSLGLPAPDFWRLLGRARRAARALPCRAPLADLACAFGYSDQAHMTREFVRWFGAAPAELRRNHKLLRTLDQPGLGNWTGEQISIR